MKKIYNVSVPVMAEVNVLVEAENITDAELIALKVACLSDAEITDFEGSDPIVSLIDEKYCANKFIYTDVGKWRKFGAEK